MPPGGFHTKPNICFSHNSDCVLATASTCDLVLRLPTVFGNNSYKFEEMLVLSFKGYEGFGKV